MKVSEAEDEIISADDYPNTFIFLSNGHYYTKILEVNLFAFALQPTDCFMTT